MSRTRAPWTIHEVEVRRERLPLTRPYVIASTAAHGGTDAVDLLLVVLRTADGTVGLGTASPVEHVTGESIDEAARALAAGTLRELLGGADARAVGALTARLQAALPDSAPAARAAVDTALWDLHARLLGVPLVELWGRPSARSMATSITLGIRSVDDTLAEAREVLGRGFRALKVKIGLDAAEDAERLARLRELAGPEVALRVDANEGYDRGRLTALADLAERFDLEMIEQPVARDVLPRLGGPGHAFAGDRSAGDRSAGDRSAGDRSVDEDGALPTSLRARLAADESLVRPRDLAMVRDACGILVVKLMKHGGPSIGREIAAAADLDGLELMWGCNDESVISITAALHCALACPATRYLDLDGAFDLARDVARGGYRLADGALHWLDAPGLGAELLD
ncbi:MAG: dipeptide epimerase [Acidobacteriota bacterium]